MRNKPTGIASVGLNFLYGCDILTMCYCDYLEFLHESECFT